MKNHLKHYVLLLAIVLIPIMIMTSCTKEEAPADPELGHLIPERRVELFTEKADDLYRLCLVWGEMKYFHPAVVNSDVDWDKVLIEKIRWVSENESPDMDKFLTDWINGTGGFEEGEYDRDLMEDSKPFRSDIDPLYFIYDDTFGPDLSELLEKLSNTNLKERKGSYADTTGIIPDFSREKKSKSAAFPSLDDDLTAFFRLWNAVNYFYPYKDGMKDMEDLFYEYLDDFVLADTPEKYALAVLSFTAELRDSHVQVTLHVYDLFGSCQLPVDIASYYDSYIVTGIWKGFEKRTELLPGDILVSINGKSIGDLVRERGRYVSVSSEERSAMSYAPVLLAVDKTEGNEIGVIRKGTAMTVTSQATAESGRTEGSAVKSGILDGNIGYMDAGSLKSQKELEKLMKDFENTDGLIIDMRRYPGVNMTETFPSYFIKKKTHFCSFTASDMQKPGSFRSFEGIYEPVEVPYRYDGKVVVLTDEFTLSQGEFTVMLLSEGKKVTVMGGTTNGTDGDVVRFPIPGGSVSFTSIGIYEPDMDGTERVGLEPDIEVVLDPRDLAEGRDTILEAAKSFLLD